MYKVVINIVVFGPTAASPIPEASPTKESADTIAEMCQQLTQGLTALQTDDPFANVPSVGQKSIASPASTHSPSPSAPVHQHTGRSPFHILQNTLRWMHNFSSDHCIYNNHQLKCSLQPEYLNTLM